MSSGVFRRPSVVAASTDENEPRRRHGSAPMTTAFGLTRRESAAAAATSSAGVSRRSLTVEAQPRKLSEPGIVHKPSPLSPKRKPLPKGSTYDKQNLSLDDDLSGKLGKLEITSVGSTMVFTEECWLI
jgi:hypothetical protein